MPDISQKTILTGDLATSGDLSDIVLTAPAENDILVRNGSNQWVNAAASAGSSTYHKQTADVATTAEEWNTLTGMSVSVEADQDYLVEMFVAFESSNSNVGMALGINGPTTGSSPIEVRGTHIHDSITHNIASYQDNNAVTISSESNDNTNFAVASIIFRNGDTAGTLLGRGRCETSAGTTTFKEGSYMRITTL